MEKELIEIENSQVSIEEKLKTVNIISRETLEDAVGITRDIKEAKKKVEETMNFFTGPLNTQLKNIRTKFKPYIDMLDKAETELKQKITAYQIEQELIRRTEEDRLRKLQEKQYKNEIKKAEKKGADLPPPPFPIEVKQEKVSGLSIRKIWDFEIINISEIPSEYLILDEKKIRKVINAGIRNIAGVVIFERAISAIGTSAISGVEDL